MADPPSAALAAAEAAHARFRAALDGDASADHSLVVGGTVGDARAADLWWRMTMREALCNTATTDKMSLMQP